MTISFITIRHSYDPGFDVVITADPEKGEAEIYTRTDGVISEPSPLVSDFPFKGVMRTSAEALREASYGRFEMLRAIMDSFAIRHQIAIGWRVR